jgi:Uma2 family endonuclease
MPKLITNINQLDMNKVYSYADYYTWKITERLELIKGKIFTMSPAPSTEHQRVSGKIHFMFQKHFYGKKCNIFCAPFDVRFPKKPIKQDGKIYDVVQPDICVICDDEKLDERGCIGAPDLVIEILSNGNSTKELKNKYDLYEANGVQEYWIVQPYEQTVMINTLTNGKYVASKLYATDETIFSSIFPTLKLPLKKIFNK